MTVLMREDDRFDPASAVLQRLFEMRRRGGFQHGITFAQPAAIEQLEPLATVGTSGQIELGRSRTCVGRLSGAALLEVGAQPLDVFPREHLRELRIRHLHIGVVEAEWPRGDDDAERPRGQAAEQTLLPLQEPQEPVRAGLCRDVQKDDATIWINADWMFVPEEMRHDR